MRPDTGSLSEGNAKYSNFFLIIFVLCIFLNSLFVYLSAHSYLTLAFIHVQHNSNEFVRLGGLQYKARVKFA
jgi:hypothetical protein